MDSNPSKNRHVLFYNNNSSGIRRINMISYTSNPRTPNIQSKCNQPRPSYSRAIYLATTLTILERTYSTIYITADPIDEDYS